MVSYDIPENVAELFANGTRQYSICDYDQPGDNIFAMQLFLSCVNVPNDLIELDDGTQVFLFNGTTRLVIDSYGLGDFDRHGYDVTVVDSTPATKPQEKTEV